MTWYVPYLYIICNMTSVFYGANKKRILVFFTKIKFLHSTSFVCWRLFCGFLQFCADHMRGSVRPTSHHSRNSEHKHRSCTHIYSPLPSDFHLSLSNLNSSSLVQSARESRYSPYPSFFTFLKRMFETVPTGTPKNSGTLPYLKII